MNITRKNFFIGSAAAFAATGLKASAPNPVGKIQGFDESFESKTDGPWEPFSDKKVRVGIAGYGVCKFGAQFFFQNHPNVEVVAASDLYKGRCAELAKVVGAKRTYTSAQAMIDKEGKNMDAVCIATDAPSHIDLVLRALDRGYHAASAVPTPSPSPTPTFTPAPPAQTRTPAVTAKPTEPVSSRTDLAAEVVRLVNEERAKQGLSALRTDDELTRAACVRASEIATSFSHTRPSGASWSTVSASAYGENIARGQRTAEKVMASWMTSEGHRANILRASYSSIGVCAVVSGGVTYWVQLFGH